jgi:hypothetical protein
MLWALGKMRNKIGRMLNDWLSLGCLASGFVEVNDFGPSVFGNSQFKIITA